MLKRMPIRPKTGTSRQISRSKRSSKCSFQEATRPSQTELTTVSPWCSPWTVVMDAWSCVMGRTTVRPLCSRNSSSSFAAVQLLARFSILSYYFVLKRGVYLALLRGRIHRKTLFHSQKLHWRRRRKKSSGEAKAAFLVANRKIGTQALHKLSYLICFLSFSSILVRIFWILFGLLVSIMCE